MSQAKHNAVWTGDEPPAGAVKKSYDELLIPMTIDFDIDINLIVCHGKKELVPEMDFDKFYIFAMMAPEILKVETDKIKELDIDGKKLKIDGGQADILRITSDIPKSVTVIRDCAGLALAVVYDACIYILNDFTHCANADQLKRSLAIFKYVVNEATKTDELFKALKSGAEEKSKRALEHALSKQFKDRLKKEESVLQSSQGLYEKYISNVVDSQRKIIATEAIINAIKENIGQVPIALKKKWKSVKKLEGSVMYENISFQRNCVKGTTTPICFEHKEKWYKFNKYEVVLNFDGNIKIFSLDKQRKITQDHPHINSGNPCWGNMSGEPQKRIAESEFDVAFVEIYTFLNHYSKEGGPYADISKWPTMDSKEIEEYKLFHNVKKETKQAEKESEMRIA